MAVPEPTDAHDRSVLHVLPHPGGGGETYVEALARIEGYRFVRAYLAPDARSGRAVVPVLGTAFAVSRAARRHAVLHVHGEVAGTLCLPSLITRPSVVTLHGLHLLRRLRGPSRAAAKVNLQLIVRAASRTICVSEAEYKEVVAIVGRRVARSVRVVHNGVSPQVQPSAEERAALRHELGIPASTIVGISIGTLDEHKDPLTPVRAALDVARTGADVALVIVGDGPLRSEVEREARADGGHTIHVLGFRPDVRRILAAADFFVLSSEREGLSFSLLEAMSLGLPAVVSDAPGNPEAVGEAGIIVSYGDVAGFAAAFSRLVNNARERRRLGTLALERIGSSFHLDGMICRTQRVYDEVVMRR